MRFCQGEGRTDNERIRRVAIDQKACDLNLRQVRERRHHPNAVIRDRFIATGRSRIAISERPGNRIEKRQSASKPFYPAIPDQYYCLGPSGLAGATQH